MSVRVMVGAAELEGSQMRHAFLGAGGIGGLLAAALARNGADVVLLMRPDTLARYGGRLIIESAVLGDFEVGVPATSGLDSEIDVLWVTTKAMNLEPALTLAPAQVVGDAIFIPLLNGVDHVQRRRRPTHSEVSRDSPWVTSFRWTASTSRSRCRSTASPTASWSTRGQRCSTRFANGSG